MKYKFILFIFCMIFLIGSVSAIQGFDNHSKILGSPGSVGSSEWSGTIVKAVRDFTFMNVTKPTTSTATYVRIVNNATAAVLGSVAVTGNVGNFAPLAINLTNGTEYRIEWNSTAGWDHACNTSMTYPINNYSVQWVNGYLSSQPAQAWGTYFCNTLTIGYSDSFVEPGNILVSLDSPSNGFTFISSNRTFNASATTINANITNATIYIWNQTSLWNTTTVNIDTSITNSSSFNINNIALGTHEWNVLYCGVNLSGESICNFAASNFTFTRFAFTIDGIGWMNKTFETDRQIIFLNITTISDILSINAKLWYDNVSYQAMTSCANSVCLINRSLDTPLVQSGDFQIKSFLWQLDIFDGSSSLPQNTSSYTQNVTRIYLQECGAIAPQLTANFTAYNETDLQRINPFKFLGTFDFWLGGGSIQRNSSFNNETIAQRTVCINPGNRTFYTDAIIEYNKDNSTLYTTRNYFFQNASLTSTTQNISLYLLPSSLATSFIIKVQDSTFSAIKDALVFIQRYYPGDNTFRTVQIVKTDSSGESIGFYQTETVDYKHIITQNGTVLLNTPQQKIFGKEVPFTLTFTIGDALGLPWSRFEDNPNINVALEYNQTTSIVSFTYVDITGNTNFAALRVFQQYGNQSGSQVCSVTSLQPSATLLCNMSGFDGSFIAKAYLMDTTEPNVVKIINFVISVAKDIFSKGGLFLAFFIIMTAFFAFIWSPTVGIIAINAAVIFVNIIGLATFSPVIIFGLITLSITVIILMES